MSRSKLSRALLTGLTGIALVAAPGALTLGCDDGDGAEAIEEIRDEAKDLTDEIEDEIDDRT